MPPASTPATAARWGRGLRLFFFFPRAVSSAPEAPAQGIFFVATSSKTYGRKRQKPRESERTGESSVVEMSHPPVGAACRTAFRSLACVGAGGGPPPRPATRARHERTMLAAKNHTAPILPGISGGTLAEPQRTNSSGLGFTRDRPPSAGRFPHLHWPYCCYFGVGFHQIRSFQTPIRTPDHRKSGTGGLRDNPKTTLDAHLGISCPLCGH